MKLCECGCGQPTKRATHTRTAKGIFKGEYNRFIQGHAMIGKNYLTFAGRHHTEETKEKQRKAHHGEKCYNWKGGKPYCKECGKLLKLRTATYCQECYFKYRIGKNTGKKNPMYKNHRFAGKNHPNWLGGISFEPYPITFNNQLKDRIRARDNFICQLCGVPELECNQRLAVHHIDYDKKNCEKNNLTSLCRSCHTKTNTNRKYWTNYFNNKKEKENARN